MLGDVSKMATGKELCQQKQLNKRLHFDQLYVTTDAMNRGSNMSAHVLLNLLNKLRKRDKMRGLSGNLALFLATSLINSVIQGTNVRFYYFIPRRHMIKPNLCP